MKKWPHLLRLVQTLIAIGLAVGIYAGIRLLAAPPPAHALPEFSIRTGEPCGTCHVNPGGGGPRTLPGLLWAARGRPNNVPQLPGLMIAAGVTNAVELYDIACAGCHGFSGEGLLGMDLAGTGISQGAARSFIRRGIPELQMPAFSDQLTAEQIDTLASFVAQLGRGDIPPKEIQLPPAQFNCAPINPISSCENR